MTHTHSEPKLTDTQALALATVKDRPRLTVSDYALMIGETEEVYSAFGYLIYNGYLRLNKENGSITTNGVC